MARGSLRHKSILGLILVVAMICSLLAGATFGLRSFRKANHKLVDQLPELGAANVLLRETARLDARNAMTAEGKSILKKDLSRVQASLKTYFEVLRNRT